MKFKSCEKCPDSLRCYFQILKAASLIGRVVDIQEVVAEEKGISFSASDDDIETVLGFRIIAKDYFRKLNCSLNDVEIDTLISEKIDEFNIK